MITLKELYSLYDIDRLIRDDERELARMRDRMGPGGGGFSGTHSGSSPKDKIGDIVGDMDELERKLAEDKARLEKERERLYLVILTVEDVHIRRILKYRFIDRNGWVKVAARMGGGNTHDSVKQAFYRWLRKQE